MQNKENYGIEMQDIGTKMQRQHDIMLDKTQRFDQL
jgi:hypothetical protein